MDITSVKIGYGVCFEGKPETKVVDGFDPETGVPVKKQKMTGKTVFQLEKVQEIYNTYRLYCDQRISWRAYLAYQDKLFENGVIKFCVLGERIFVGIVVDDVSTSYVTKLSSLDKKTRKSVRSQLKKYFEFDDKSIGFYLLPNY